MGNSNNYLRQVGIPEEKFTLLLSKLQQEIDRDLVENKMKKRGIICQKKLGNIVQQKKQK